MAHPPEPEDKTRIDLDHRQDLEYWMKRLSVSEEQLRTAVQQVGTDPDAVRQHIAGGNAG